MKILPIGTIYKDPRNEYSYFVGEKKVNDTLSKTGSAYFGTENPIVIEVPEKYMKIDNPKRANIMSIMKDKIIQLEKLNADLMTKLNAKGKYQQIKELMCERKYFENEHDIFCVQDGIVFQMRIRNKDSDKGYNQLQELKEAAWNNTDILNKIMGRQGRIQEKLLKLLSNETVQEIFN